MDPISAAAQAVLLPAASLPAGSRQTEETAPKPVFDEYIPAEPRASAGLYQMGRDETGQPKIFFDDPEAENAASAPQEPAQSKPAERCTADTSQVDREIRQLREKLERLERQLQRETDETARQALERQLAQVTRELSQKDNDAYRRQHTKFS